MSRAEIIGICGGIGSGKSVVSRVLRLRGERVYDCDLEARRLMESSPEIRAALLKAIGPEAFAPDGRLDRQVVASRLFSDGEVRREVNRVVHAEVRRDVERRASRGSGPLYVESAILFSSGLADLCSEILLVEAPESMRIERVKERSALSEEQIAARMEAQAAETGSHPRVKRIINDNIHPILTQLPLSPHHHA